MAVEGFHKAKQRGVYTSGYFNFIALECSPVVARLPKCFTGERLAVANLACPRRLRCLTPQQSSVETVSGLSGTLYCCSDGVGFHAADGLNGDEVQIPVSDGRIESD